MFIKCIQNPGEGRKRMGQGCVLETQQRRKHNQAHRYGNRHRITSGWGNETFQPILLTDIVTVPSKAGRGGAGGAQVRCSEGAGGEVSWDKSVGGRLSNIIKRRARVGYKPAVPFPSALPGTSAKTDTQGQPLALSLTGKTGNNSNAYQSRDREVNSGAYIQWDTIQHQINTSDSWGEKHIDKTHVTGFFLREEH